MRYLPCLELEVNTSDTKAASASVVWLHGLGADGHDFEPIVPELRLPASLPVRFLFPHAPSIPVTVNGGMVMPAWYDILEMDIDRKIDEAQVLASARQVAALIDRELERGVDSRRIIVAGFSQGGAVAYQVALSYPRALGGLLALSTYFATQDRIQPHSANRDLSVLVCHGEFDPVVPEELGQRALRYLKGMGYAPEYRTYATDHAVCLEEIHDISHWLQRCLGQPSQEQEPGRAPLFF